QRGKRPPAALRGHLGDAPGGGRVPPGAPGAGAGVATGVPDVVDGGAEHLTGRLEAHAADSGELIRRQRGSPRTAAPDFRHPALGHGWQFFAHAPKPSPGAALILRVPFLVAPLHRFQRVLCRLPGGIRSEPVLARGGTVVVLDGVVLEAVPPPPSLFAFH